MRQHTVLVIAHRLSTVERADNIIVIDRGCVVEQGPHSQLMASKGLFYKLVQRQVLGIETGAEPLNPPVVPPNKSESGGQLSRQTSDTSESECHTRY